MTTKAFRFTRDVQHQPAAQLSGHKKGQVWFIEGDTRAYGDTVSLLEGHGVSDSFKVGDEVEWLTGDELKPYIHDRALDKLTDEERAVLGIARYPRCKVCGAYADGMELPEDGGWGDDAGSYCQKHSEDD